MESAVVPITGPEIVEEAQVAVRPEPVQGSSILDMPPDVFQAGLDRRRQNHKALIQWVAQALVEGTDFGKIHVVGKDKCDKGKWCKNESHFSKPVLFKPGSEKICGMLGVIPTFPTLKDYEAAAVSGVKVETIILRCELREASGRILAEGVGARSVSKDYGDINKSLKMAEKSGQIDATLRLAGLSEVFTQDLEDMVALPEKSSPAAPEEPTGPSMLEHQLSKSLGEHPEPISAAGSLNTVAPGHCVLKGCGGEVELYVSESKAFPGREYWCCSVAHDMKIKMLNEGATNKLANAAVAAHYREWAGPWTPPALSGPDPTDNIEQPSIFDPEAISKQVALKLAAEAK